MIDKIPCKETVVFDANQLLYKDIGPKFFLFGVFPGDDEDIDNHGDDNNYNDDNYNDNVGDGDDGLYNGLDDDDNNDHDDNDPG